MDKIFMKVVKFDEVAGTLHVKFASEKNIRPIDEYDEHKFLVMNFNENFDSNLVIWELGKVGYRIAQTQEQAEENVRNSTKLQEYKNLVGNEYEFDSHELFACKAAENQPPTEGLMEI